MLLGYLFGDYILPAAGRLFAPDLPSNPGATNPAPGLVEPQTDPEEQRSTDNVPSVTDQTDIELGIIGEPNPKCDPNAAPEPERLLNLPVSAKIRNYLDEKSHDQRGSQPSIRSVWNGLDPRDPNIENYEA